MQATLEARERGERWCAEQKSHTVLMGEHECFICGAELPVRRLQVASRAHNPGGDAADRDVFFVGAGEKFDTPEGPMRAANGVCRCGRRGAQHGKFYPWTSTFVAAGSTVMTKPCEGFVAVERGEAPGSDRVPRIEPTDTLHNGTLVYGKPRCGCGHHEREHADDRSCTRCSCRLFAVR